MKYDILLFDADETLFDFRASEKYALANAAKDLTIPYEEAIRLPVYSAINTAIWKEFEQGIITQAKLKVERFRRFLMSINYEADAASLAASFIQHLSEASILLPGAEELIRDLSSYYRMIIVTNGLTHVQTNRMKKSPIKPYFEAVVISEEIGLSKPDAGIFDYALLQMKVSDKSKVLMIGDSLSSDIKGGNNAGIDTCWFNKAMQSNVTDAAPTYEVHSFLELKTLLLP